MIMQIQEATLAFQLIEFDAADRLATTRQLLAYLTAGVPDHGAESFWLACLNANRRPICRLRLKVGVSVVHRVLPRDVFLAVMLAEARAFACLRIQPQGEVAPNLADGRMISNLREVSRLLGFEFVDYLIARTDGGGCHSWREHERPRD